MKRVFKMLEIKEALDVEWWTEYICFSTGKWWTK
jgi:hypothetical protein